MERGYEIMDVTKIAIFLFDGITALDAVGPYEVLAKIPQIEVTFVAFKPGAVQSTGGLKLNAERSIGEDFVYDIIVIPGGEGVEKILGDDIILSWIRRMHQQTKYTVSVCTGALLLGAAGLLQSVRATTHWRHLERLAAFGATPVEMRYVQDGRILTSAGVSAGIDMSLHLVELLRGTLVAQIIQLALEYDPVPPFNAGSPKTAPKEAVDLLRLRKKEGEETK
jgi:transcriptional regulator GlxA family with amidase domain